MEKCEKHLWWGSAMLKTRRISQHPSIPKQCLLYLLYVRLQSQSSFLLQPFVWGVPGPGDGIHIAPLLPRGTVKWPRGKQDQWRILLDVESFWQAFINLSFKTAAPFPLYVFYGETDEWLTVIATRREIPLFGVTLPETCYPNSLTCLASITHCKRTTICSK